MQGQPSYDITQDQQRSIIHLRFTVPQISELLNVSKRTIERRLDENDMTARAFNTISDEDLDSEVRSIKTIHPSRGSKNLAGHLASRNIRVPSKDND